MNHKVTPKDFFLWAGAVISLYGGIAAFLSLIFEYINYAYPDPLEYIDPYSGSMRFAMASLIVLAPVCLVLLRLIRRDIEAHEAKADIWVRRWALVLTLFLAGAAMVIDLITLVNTFLGGDLSTRFILKVVVILLVAGALFLHFLADLRGYWVREPKKARMVSIGTAVLVLVSIVSGFFIMGSPSTVRLMRFDDQRVSDLQNIQSQVTYYWQAKQKLPVNARELEDPLTGFVLPKDPATGADYGYRVTKAPYSFEVCADFSLDSETGSRPAATPVALHIGGVDAETWQHAAGQTCFERTIDPDKYPQLKR
jgi:hypothetical protein